MTAIRLWFHDVDIVSTHTLAAAAFHVTEDVCNSSKALPDSMLSQMYDMIKPKYREEVKKKFRQKFNKTANFLKHAARDPSTLHYFDPDQTELLLFMGVQQYKSLSKDNIPEMKLFSIWFMVNHPGVFDEIISLPISLQAKNLFGTNKTQFYQELLPLVQEYYT